MACAAAQKTTYSRPSTSYTAGIPSSAASSVVSQITLPVCESIARTLRSRVPVKIKPPAVATGPVLGKCEPVVVENPEPPTQEPRQEGSASGWSRVQIVGCQRSPGRRNRRQPATRKHEAKTAFIAGYSPRRQWALLSPAPMRRGLSEIGQQRIQRLHRRALKMPA